MKKDSNNNIAYLNNAIKTQNILLKDREEMLCYFDAFNSFLRDISTAIEKLNHKEKTLEGKFRCHTGK